MEDALRLDPLAMPLVRRSAAKRWNEGKREEAGELFLRLIRAKRNELATRAAYADFFMHRAGGDPVILEGIKKNLRAALVESPGDPAFVSRLFEVSAQTGGERRRVLEMLAGNDAESALLFSKLIGRLPDPDGALKTDAGRRLEQAVSQTPGDARLAAEASEFFRRSGRGMEAMEILRKHVTASPWSLDLRVRLGVLCFAAGENDEALKMLNDVLAVDPSRAMAHQALAKYYRKQGARQEAVAHESERIKIQGGDPAEFIALADEWLALDQPANARLLLEKAVFEHPRNFEARLKLAMAARRDPATRAGAAALFRDAEKVMKEEGGTPAADFFIEAAEAALAEGNSKAAEDHLRAAIRAFPSEEKTRTAEALRRLAGLWEKENRNAPAAAALRQRAAALEKTR